MGGGDAARVGDGDAARVGGAQHGDGGGRCELRLALVCYGGVSLAIYMHGVTKEIAKLAAASTAFELDPGRNPFPDDDSAHGWFDLLAALAADEVVIEGRRPGGTHLKVVVDLIAGTSAGGINGVCLAKALAQNRSLDPIRQLWLDRGDIAHLLTGWRWVPWKLRLPASVLGMLNGRAPLRGDDMCRWLVAGMGQIDDGDRLVDGVDSLVPADQSLELFVPITDFHGVVRQVPLADARHANDRAHRQVLRFRHDGASPVAQLGPAWNHALAFAARATSSFPGGFPALSFDDFRTAVPSADLSQLGTDILREYRLGGADPERTQFVDGGVLDNRPFEVVVDAIGARPAGTQVDRRLLFLDPDPGASGESGGDAPSVITTVVGSLLRIPRVEPIAEDLARIEHRNRMVGRVRDVVEARFDGARERAAGLLEGPHPTDDAGIIACLQRVEDAALDATVTAERHGYLRARGEQVLERLTELVGEIRDYPPDSWTRQATATVLHRWAEQDGVLERHPDPAATAQLRRLLDEFDLDAVARRIRFAIAALNWWYRDVDRPGFPTRVQLDGGKRRLYGLLVELGGLRHQVVVSEPVRRAVMEVFSRTDLEALRAGVVTVDEVVASRRDALARLRDEVAQLVPDARNRLLLDLHQVVLDVSRGWDDDPRLDLLTRHLAFPFFDVALFPLQRLGGVGETDRVEVYRIGRDEDGTLRPADRRDRCLAGASLHHFGAFFDRAGREKDHLWGRLDAAMALTGLLLDARRGSPADSDAPLRVVPATDLARTAGPLVEAILAEERPALDHIHPLVDELADLNRQLRGRALAAR